MSKNNYNPKKTIVISSMIQKGGVGKTTIISILSYMLADAGYKVLCIDTDGQKNFSSSYNLKSDSDKNFYKAFVNDEDISNHIIPTEYKNIDFVVSDSSLKYIETEMYSMPFREQRVNSILSNIIKERIYDFILIDTNPTLGFFNTSVLYATDEILIPVEPAGFSVDGLIDFVNFYNGTKKYKPNLNILGIVYSRIDMRQNISKDFMDAIGEYFDDLVFKTSISTNTSIKTAQTNHVAIPHYIKGVRKTEQNSRSLEQFKNLTKEVIEVVKKREQHEEFIVS